MGDAKPTQGPITVGAVTGGYALRAASVGKGYFSGIGIATQRDPHPVHGGGVDDATAYANARLWAAAPLLLERLKQRVLACPCAKSLDCAHCAADINAMQGLGSDNG